jgi:hypothetical protein
MQIQNQMKILSVSIILVMMLFTFSVSGQAITKQTIPVISGTVCPGATSYQVSIPQDIGACHIKWTVVNGEIDGPDNGSRVTVNWSDIPGAKATITVKFSSCESNNPNEGAGDTKDELILSVKQQHWESYGSSINVDYCTKAQANLTVPRMFVQGTGGIDGPPLTEVTYVWTLPSGWREVGTGYTGTFGTTTNILGIEPIGCSVPGSVMVYGTLVGAGPFCNSSEPSETATIVLNGANPNVTIGPQAGYTGGSACNTNPVTFFATINAALGCISSYDWVYPASWSFVSQSGNSITLRPTGSSADSNPISVTVKFACGSSIKSGVYTPPFHAPEISAPAYICSDASTVSVANVDPGTAVNWVVSSNMTILSGQGTRTITIKANASTVGGEATINATLTNCSAVSVPTKSVWSGTPYLDLGVNGSPLPPGNFLHVTQVPGAYSFNIFNYSNSNVSMDVTFYSNKLSGPHTTTHYPNAGHASEIDYGISFVHPTQTYFFTVSTSNACGTFSTNAEISSDNNVVNVVVSSYPNPATTSLTVQLQASGSPSVDDTESKTPDEPYRVDLFDKSSQLVYSTQSSKWKTQIPLDGIPNGTYYLHVRYKGALLQRQVIVGK